MAVIDIVIMCIFIGFYLLIIIVNKIEDKRVCELTGITGYGTSDHGSAFVYQWQCTKCWRVILHGTQKEVIKMKYCPYCGACMDEQSVMAMK